MLDWIMRAIFGDITAYPPPPPPPPPVETNYQVMVMFGARLRIARAKHRLTQRELAALLPKTTANDVSNWEYARSSPRASQRAALYELLGSDLP